MNAADIVLGPDCRRARVPEARTLGGITADAFRDDPFNRWLFGTYGGIRNLFMLQARRIYAPRGYCYTLGDVGAAMWMLPGSSAAFGPADYLRFAIPTLFLSGPRAVMRGVRTGEAMERRHPDFAHAYLFSIGLRPSARGKGLRRALIQPVLDACDRAGLPAYLENSNPANTGFYTARGFAPLGEAIVVEPGAPPLAPMLRPPRRP